MKTNLALSGLLATMGLVGCAPLVPLDEVNDPTINNLGPNTQPLLSCLATKVEDVLAKRRPAGAPTLSFLVGSSYDKSGTAVGSTLEVTQGPHPSDLGPMFRDALARMVLFDIKTTSVPQAYMWPNIKSRPADERPSFVLYGNAVAHDEMGSAQGNGNVTLGPLTIVGSGSQTLLRVTIMAAIFDPLDGQLYRTAHRDSRTGQRVMSLSHARVTVNAPASRASVSVIGTDVGAGLSAKLGPVLHQLLQEAADVAVFDLQARLWDLPSPGECMPASLEKRVTIEHRGLRLAMAKSPKPAKETNKRSTNAPVGRVPLAAELMSDGTLRWRVQMVESGYLACYLEDADHRVFQLFPNSRRSASNLAAGTTLTLGTTRDPFILEWDRGAEQVMCVSSALAPHKTLSRVTGGRLTTSPLPVSSLGQLEAELAQRHGQSYRLTKQFGPS